MNKMALVVGAWMLLGMTTSTLRAQSHAAPRSIGSGSQGVVNRLKTLPPAGSFVSVGNSHRHHGMGPGHSGHHHHHHHGRFGHYPYRTSPFYFPYYSIYYPYYPTLLGYGAYSYNYGYSGYSGGYGPSAYDTYVAALQEQNSLLRQQLAAAQNAKPDDPNKAPARVNVPLKNRKTPDEQAQDRRRVMRERANQLTLAGSRLFTSGNYRRAADRFRDAARLATDDPTPNFYLAQALFASRQYPEAAQAIKNGLKLNPDWLEIEFDMRSLYADDEQILPQLSDLAQELKDQPLNRDAMFLLGFELFVTGQKDKARTILEQCARLEPNDAHLKPFFDFFEKQNGDAPPDAAAKPNANSAPKPAGANVAQQFPGIKLPSD